MQNLALVVLFIERFPNHLFVCEILGVWENI